MSHPLPSPSPAATLSHSHSTCPFYFLYYHAGHQQTAADVRALPRAWQRYSVGAISAAGGAAAVAADPSGPARRGAYRRATPTLALPLGFSPLRIRFEVDIEPSLSGLAPTTQDVAGLSDDLLPALAAHMQRALSGTWAPPILNLSSSKPTSPPPPTSVMQVNGPLQLSRPAEEVCASFWPAGTANAGKCRELRSGLLVSPTCGSYSGAAVIPDSAYAPIELCANASSPASCSAAAGGPGLANADIVVFVTAAASLNCLGGVCFG